MAYQDGKQLVRYIQLVCILCLVSATSIQDIPECGEGKIVKQTNDGYKCVCNREKNYFTMSDGRTCGYLSGGCPLGEELQDNGECRACQRGTFKNISGAGLCKKQTNCEMLDLETVSYGNSMEDAKCGSTRKTTLITVERSTSEPLVSTTGVNATHSDEGPSVVKSSVLYIVVVVLVVIAFVACVCVWKRHTLTRMWRNMWRKKCRAIWRNAPRIDDHGERTLTGVINDGPSTAGEEKWPLTEVRVVGAQSVSSQSSQRKLSEMTDEQKNCLQVNQDKLVRNMAKVDRVCDCLLSSCALTTFMVEDIKAENTHSDKVRALLTLMPKRPAGAFDEFYKALNMSGNEGLARQLEPYLTSNLSTG